jgi:hypothetical protein
MPSRRSWILVVAGLAALLVCFAAVRTTLRRRARHSATPVRQVNVRRFDDLAEASLMPPQQQYSPAPDPGPNPPFIEMGDLRVPDYIVRDVSLTAEGKGWRWTYLEPTLRFPLHDYDHQRFIMDFSVVSTTFKDTGPVTLSCYINDRLLTRVHCPHPGDYRLEQVVPAAWLREVSPTIVRAVLDKVWTAPSDGARLGYVLLRAGFQK